MTGTVLIVDDSLTVRMDLAAAFEAAGFDPVPCATIAEAKDAFSQKPADIVVLDVVLPDGDGVELLKEIKTTQALGEAAVIMLSSEADIGHRLHGLQTGADEYVGKPYDTGYVIARAQELVRSRRGASDDASTVLVIDDSPTFSNKMREALEAAGYRVLTAASGEDGLRVASDRRPDVILVDSMLPGIDGATVIRHLRLDFVLSGIPCILLTGSGDKGTEVRALDAGADDFLLKDADESVILAKVAAVVSREIAETESSSAGASLLGPKKILAVDDSATYLNRLADVLRGDSYDVIMAKSGEEALDLLAIEPVDCILLDLMMPGMDGRETCARIKSTQVVRDIPVIMLTAVEDQETLLECLTEGADDFVSKSSEFEVLRARVRAQLRRKQFEDQHRRVRDELLQKELEVADARSAQLVAETRAELVEELERKNEELQTFNYSVSHDLRTPLRAIKSFSEILLIDYQTGLDSEAVNYLERIHGATVRMGELVEGLLAFSRAGNAEIECRDVNLTEIAHESWNTIKELAPHRMAEVEIEEGLETYGDPTLLRVVVDNLIGNAWKYSANAAVARIRFFGETIQSETAFAVNDNGIGFDMKYADKMFRPFERLHSSAEFQGSGIGLATVSRIIARHGGRIWADSEKGRGTTIRFTVGT